jgi:hypothetical protein
MYTNGELITSNAAPSGPASAETSPLRLAAHAAKAQFFKGTIDDVRIYNRALSLDDPAGHADAGRSVTGGREERQRAPLHRKMRRRSLTQCLRA